MDEDLPAPLLIPIAKAARLLGCCRQTLYKMEQRGELRMVRPFKRTMVPRSEIERLVRGEPLLVETSAPAVVKKPRPKKVKLTPRFPGG